METFGRSMEMFRQLDKLRRAWQALEPYPGVSKSDFGAMMILAHDAQPEEGNSCPPTFTWQPDARGLSLSALAELMKQSAPAISQRVNALENAGYVERVTGGKDRRVTRVRLTQTGTEVLRQANERFCRRVDGVLDALTPAETETMMRVLDKLVARMDETGKEDERC